MPEPMGPRQMSTRISPADDFAALDGGDGGCLGGEDAGRAGLAVDAVGIDDAGVDGGALDDRAFGGEIAAGEVTVEVDPLRRAASGDMMTSSGSMPSCICRRSRR